MTRSIFGLAVALVIAFIVAPFGSARAAPMSDTNIFVPSMSDLDIELTNQSIDDGTAQVV
tara:strand:+ start:6050 stop:6229 length:180 start_codon:yes stop_codon:yes gene_type:complete